MTLWFDVTDLQWWPYSYLTGIQRTEVCILLEILKIRHDVKLFSFDATKNTLRQVDFRWLPTVVRGKLFSGSNAPTGYYSGNGDATNPAVAQPSLPGAASVPALSRRFRTLPTRIRTRVAPVLRRTIGYEATSALKDFLKSGRDFVRVLRNRPPSPAAAQAAALALDASPEAIIFQPGDVCLSLSASWISDAYGDVIEINLKKSGAKCINLIYDLIPALFPEWVTPEQSERIARWTRKQIHNADYLLTISKFQKGVIEQFIRDEKLPRRPVEAIRLGDNPEFLATTGGKSQSLSMPRFVPDKPFVVCVSTLDVRKNQSLLYHVWRKLSQELGPDCPQLLLIGTPHLHITDLMHQIRYDRTVNKLIIPLRDIIDEELAWYYKNCLFTTYPSVYEGWGLPVSESLALGKYCICSNRTSLAEAGGDLVEYFDPQDFYGGYELFRRAIQDPEYVRQRESDVRARHVPKTWKMAAEQVCRVIEHVSSAAMPAGAAPAALAEGARSAS